MSIVLQHVNLFLSDPPPDRGEELLADYRQQLVSAMANDRTPPPAILPLIRENLPIVDLAIYKSGVTWDLEWRDGANGKPGGWTKVLKNPSTGANAKSDKPTTWGDVLAVLDHYERFGFVVSESDPFTFLDLDNAIDLATGKPKPWAQTIIDRFPNGYWERSTTGTGVKGLVRGRSTELRSEDGRTRNRILTIGDGKIEIFYWGKFTALTGHRLACSSTTIGDSQAALETLIAELCPEPTPQPIAPSPELSADDQTITDRLRHMTGMWRLYAAGDCSAYGNDHSRGDQALCNGFVSCGANSEDQINRLFRTSALMREKWDRKDYRDRTIAKSLDGTVAPWEGWNRPEPAVIVEGPNRLKNGAVIGNPQDAGTGDNCASVRDELAALRAEKAALLQQLAERDIQLAATRNRAEKAEAELVTLQLLQSATMTLLRSKTMRPGEKVLGLASLFEAEAAQRRGAVDADGWSNVPVGRLADAGGCSTDTASKHLSTIASTGVLEARTITERDPNTGEVRKRRQIRLPAPSDSVPASDLVGRITMLSKAVPERDPADQGWGGKRVCPDCGDVGTITVTTIACVGCGVVLSTTKTTQAPADDTSKPPYPHLAGTKNGRGYIGSRYPQDDGSGREEWRERARQDLAGRPWATETTNVASGRTLIAQGSPAGSRYRPGKCVECDDDTAPGSRYCARHGGVASGQPRPIPLFEMPEASPSPWDEVAYGAPV
jgi:NrS-1  polymerase HBD domain